MKAKKIFAMALTFITAVGLIAGCGTTGGNQSASTDNNKTENAGGTEKITEKTTETAKDASTGGKTLVVYYSATGNTKDVAETIAQVTGADL